METALTILIAVAIIGLTAFVLIRARKQNAHEAMLERERLSRRVEGHREEAALHATRAEALEEKAVRSRKLESAHHQRAAEAERELGRR